MKLEFRDNTPFDNGWIADKNYRDDKLWFSQDSFLKYKKHMGFDYKNPNWSIWDDLSSLNNRLKQFGSLDELIGKLDIKKLLSIGSGQPFYEIFLSSRLSHLKIIASDINYPISIQNDILKAPSMGFKINPENIKYIRLDVSSPSSYCKILSNNIDAIFTVASFCVVDDNDWINFLKCAYKNNCKYFILFHAEELPILGQIKHLFKRIFASNKRGVLTGFLRSKSHVISIFKAANYQLAAYSQCSDARSHKYFLIKKLLGLLGLHYHKAAYLFARPDINVNKNNIDIKKYYT